MPFKDRKRRLAYYRQYKKERKQPHPLAGYRAYICPRFPGLQVGRAFFDGGFLVTDKPDIQAEVEQHHEYGKFIIPLKLDLSRLREDDGLDEEEQLFALSRA